MILFPAIDLKEAHACGSSKATWRARLVFHRDPAEQAMSFEAQGFEYLHVVNLDGAFAGKPVDAAAVERILETVALPIQLGGGIRDSAAIEACFDKGVHRVIIGTAAVRDPALVRYAARRFPDRIAVALDARDGKVAVKGWAESSELGVLDIAQQFEDAGVAALIYTDIARDGLLGGLDLEAAIALAEAGRHPRHRRGGSARWKMSGRCSRRGQSGLPAPSPGAPF